jgi:hypothetical protein
VSPRGLLGRGLLVGTLWLLGGTVGLVVGAGFVVYDLVSRPAPRDLLVLAVLLFGLVPLVVLAGGLPDAAGIGPGFVEDNLVAHYLAGAGLALLVVGVLREVRSGPAGDSAEVEVRPPRPSGPSTDRGAGLERSAPRAALPARPPEARR